MYRIIITAGGSKEAIDNVRAITNAATGTLGSKIADEFLNSYSEDIEELGTPGLTSFQYFVPSC